MVFSRMPDWSESELEALRHMSSICSDVSEFVRLAVMGYLNSKGLIDHMHDASEELEYEVSPAGLFFEGFFPNRVYELCLYRESLTKDGGDTIKTCWRLVREYLKMFGFITED